MNLSIVSVKKSQINASKDVGVATIKAPKSKVKNVKDFTGVPEAEAVKTKKPNPTTKVRSERKVATKKAINAEVKEVVRAKAATKEKEPIKKTTPKFTLVDYSEKSIALFGDTKPIKEELKKLGGRFNINLRPFDEDNRVPGWVFPKKCREDLLKLIK